MVLPGQRCGARSRLRRHAIGVDEPTRPLIAAGFSSGEPTPRMTRRQCTRDPAVVPCLPPASSAPLRDTL